jgi:hypothetical protein
LAKHVLRKIWWSFARASAIPEGFTVRHLANALVLVCATATVAEADEPWEIGEVQYFPSPTVIQSFKAIEVIGPDEVLVRGVRLEYAYYPLLGSKKGLPERVEVETFSPFVLKGVPTKDIKPGAQIDVPTFCTVKSAKPVNGIIRFVVIPGDWSSPRKEPPRDCREAIFCHVLR